MKNPGCQLRSIVLATLVILPASRLAAQPVFPFGVFPLATNADNALAYSVASDGDRFLVAVQGRQNTGTGEPTAGEIATLLLSPSGAILATNETGGIGYEPRVAFGVTNYLVVWGDESNGGSILGQFIDRNGQASQGPPFGIANVPFNILEHPFVAFNGTNFLVAWDQETQEGRLQISYLVFDQGYDGGGAVVNQGTLDFPAHLLGVSAGDGRFLLAAEAGAGVYGLLFNNEGVPQSVDPIPIDTSSANSSAPGAVGWNPAAGQFVVVFAEQAGANSFDLFARLVSSSGTVGARKVIATGAPTQLAPLLASDGQTMLLTWNQGFESGNVSSRVRYFNSALDPIGAETVAFESVGPRMPTFCPVAFNGRRFLLVGTLARNLGVGGDIDFGDGDLFARFMAPIIPVFLSQPRHGKFAPGETAIAAATVAGPPPITYQWRKNGADIPGATSNVLVLNNITFADAGAYTLLAANANGTAVSRETLLEVLEPPTILEQPASQLSVGGFQPVSFTVVAAGAPPLRYQWRRNGVNLPNETNATLTIPAPIPIAAQGTYSVSIANPVGATNSARALLTLAGPALDFQDAFANRLDLDVNGFGGGSNTFATKETGEPNHAGKLGGSSVWSNWRAPDNGVVTFRATGSGFDTLLAAYTGNSVDALTFVAADDDSGPFFSSVITFNATAGVDYAIVVDGLAGATGKIFLSWEFTGTLVTAPVILTQPVSLAVVPGGTAAFSVAVASATPATLQWFRDGAPLPGQNGNTLTINNVNGNHAGTYFVRVGNGSGFFANSALVSLDVVTSPFFSGSADKLEEALLRRTLVGPPEPDGKGGSIVAPSAGTVFTRNLSSSRGTDEPNHAGAFGAASRWFVLQPTVSGTFVIDTIGSDFDTVLSVYTGTLLALNRVAQDDSGAPDGVRSLVRFQANSGVDYLVAVDGANDERGIILLNYQFGSAPEIVEGPASQIVPDGNVAQLRVVPAAVTAVFYQWQFNGAPIDEATNATLVVPDFSKLNEGTYGVVVSNFAGTALRSAQLTFLDPNAPPSATLSLPAAGTVYVTPTNVIVSATVVGSDITRVDFFASGRKIGSTAAPPYAVTWAITKAGNYKLTAKAFDARRRSGVSAVVNVTAIAPVTIVKQPLPREVELGKTARFKVVAKGSAPLTYQWYRDGNLIGGATQKTLSVTNVQSDLLGNYSVRITNPAGTVESAPAALTLKPEL